MMNESYYDHDDDYNDHDDDYNDHDDDYNGQYVSVGRSPHSVAAPRR